MQFCEEIFFHFISHSLSFIQFCILFFRFNFRFISTRTLYCLKNQLDVIEVCFSSMYSIAFILLNVPFVGIIVPDGQTVKTSDYVLYIFYFFFFLLLLHLIFFIFLPIFPQWTFKST